MKISIIGSSSFAKEMVEYHNKLLALGHENNLHEHYLAMGNGERQDLVERIH